MRYLIGFLVVSFVAIGSIFFISAKNNAFELVSDKYLPSAPEAQIIESSQIIEQKNFDIGPQKPLTIYHQTIKAIYATSWSASSQKKIDYLIKLIKETELNAIVIDIKDYSGYIAYNIDLPEIEKYKAKEIRILKINSVIKQFHDEGIYVIARITIFQDPILAKARPDLAVHSRSKLIPNTQNLTPETLWLDHKNLAWIDPAAKEAWDYNIAIAKDAASRGFDEINFDYIRFPSDGDLNDMKFPFWNGTTPKNEVIKSFFKYLREQLPDVKISADLFGLTTINNNDLGIGQVIEDAYEYFDYVAPMVYPSHYAKMFLGYKNPAQYPYEVIKYSMDSALKRLQNYELGIKNNGTSTVTTANQIHSSKLRPWLQDFDLGADYDAEMVKKQIQAVYDAASSTPELINGWMMWNPKNIYTKEAFNEAE